VLLNPAFLAFRSQLEIGEPVQFAVARGTRPSSDSDARGYHCRIDDPTPRARVGMAAEAFGEDVAQVWLEVLSRLDGVVFYH